MKARYQFALGFRKIEWQPARLRHPRDQEQNEAEELRHHEPQPALRFDDMRDPERASQHHHTQQRQTHEDLVTQHLCGSADTTEQRVFVVRRPTC